MDRGLVLKALALGMGVAGTVLAIMKESTNTILILLGIGVVCLAINALDSSNGAPAR